LVYKATIKDTYLLDNTTATGSTNYAETSHKIGVELSVAELSANIYDAGNNKTGSCTIEVSAIVNNSSKAEFYQLITLSNCQGEGRLKLVVSGGVTMYDDDSSSDLNDESTIDLAGNCNV
jgi:hypothetical protein